MLALHTHTHTSAPGCMFVLKCIQECNLPDDMTFDEFFKRRVLPPIYQCMRRYVHVGVFLQVHVSISVWEIFNVSVSSFIKLNVNIF